MGHLPGAWAGSGPSFWPVAVLSKLQGLPAHGARQLSGVRVHGADALHEVHQRGQKVLEHLEIHLEHLRDPSDGELRTEGAQK